MLRVLKSFGRVMQWIILAGAGICAILIIAVFSAMGIVYSHFNGDAQLPADCALVFGAAVYASSQPGPAIVRRISTASSLYRSHQVNRLILSGGRGEGNQASEAEVMKKQAIMDGVKASDIILEDQSHSTWENLLYSQNLTSHCKSVVGISDAYHLARIELLARRLGWKDLMTTPAVIHPEPGSENRSVLREAFAYLYYAFSIDRWISTDTLQKHLPVGGQKVSMDRDGLKDALVPVNKLT